MNTLNQNKTNWKQKILHELKDYWLIVFYMAIFFCAFSNYRRLILAHYQISYEEYGISIIKALILAKIILVGEVLRLGSRFNDKPLIIPTLYKGFLFTACAAVFDVGESVIRSFIYWKGSKEFIDEFMKQFNYEWLAGGIVVFFTFIPFFAVRELNQVLGKGTLGKLFFQKRAVMEP